MKGHIQQRGKHSWRLKFDRPGKDATGERRVQFVTFRGTKREAQTKLAELIASVGADTYIEPSKVTVGDFVRARIDAWEAAGNITARTAQRYRQLCQHQIAPHIGGKPVQKLKPLDIEAWHTALRSTVAARTIGHCHRLLSQALGDAERNGIVHRNVGRTIRAPKVAESEMPIVRSVAALVDKLRGHRLETPAVIALTTGMRLGEILALKWSRVHLDRGVIEVREALEETKVHGVRYKPPKSKAGRRDITLPDVVVDVLRDHRRAQLELRMKLGAGRLPDDGLLFSRLDGGPLRPGNVSSDWSEDAESLGVPGVTFHGLRHTHASQLIDAGIDVVTVSKRLGHAKPSVTLSTYAHLFKTDDSKAAAAINAALSGA